MRRGLMAWDAKEVPVATIEARQQKLREAMARDGLDAFIAYTNIARPAAVSWMSGFTPYWSEGVYCLPARGTPVFATALSKRVAEWIGTVMAVGEVVPTPAPGAAIGKQLAEWGVNKAGILELDDLPAKQATALMQNAPQVEFSDATALFAPARAQVDDAERALVNIAAQLARECMDLVDSEAGNAQDIIAAVEKHARLAGAEEIFISIAPDLTLGAQLKRTDTAQELGEAFALRISLAYKAGWVRLARSFARSGRGATDFDRLQQMFDTFAPTKGASIHGMLTQIFADNGATLKNWTLEQPRGGYPLAIVAGRDVENAWSPQGPSVLSVEVETSGGSWLAAKPLA
ncbi:MAG: aminopeptidase P family N-terminal domain-containing protein [Beijerinckiaceae bacterium]